MSTVQFTPAFIFGTTPNKAERIGGLFYIKGVDAAAAKRLSKLMPQSSLSMAQNESPTVQQVPHLSCQATLSNSRCVVVH